jgi:O-antigen/teichoic acid export membrane protein
MRKAARVLGIPRALFASQLRINMVSGVAVTVVNAALMAVAFPLYLHFLGYEQYGVWLVLSTVIGFAQLGNLGIGQAVTKLVAEEYGRGDIAAVQQYVSSAVAILVVSGLLVLSAILLFRTHIIASFKLSEENAQRALRLLPYVGLLSVYVLIVQSVNATLSGLGRMDLANYAQTAGRMAAVLVSAVLLVQGRAITSLLLGTVCSYAFIHVGSLILIRRIARIRFLRLGDVSSWRVKRLLGFGAGLFGGSLISMLVGPFNKLMLSRYAGVASVTIYEIAFQASMQVRGLVEVGLRALVPEVSRIGADLTAAARSRIAALNRRTAKLVLVTALPAYVLLALSAPLLFQLWLGRQCAPDLPRIFRIMAVGGFVSLIAVPAFYVLMGSGRVVACFWGFGIPAFFNVACLTTLVAISGRLKTEYVAYSFVLGTVLSSLYLIWRSRQVYRTEPCLPPVEVCSMDDAALPRQSASGAHPYYGGT